MEGLRVSAFRERGLRAGVSRSAEPPWLVVKLKPERKADTMKTYLLKTSPLVETKARRTAGRKPAPEEPAPAVAPAPPAGPVLCIGLDVHNDSIAVSIAPSDSVPVCRMKHLGGCRRDRSFSSPSTATLADRINFAAWERAMRFSLRLRINTTSWLGIAG